MTPRSAMTAPSPAALRMRRSRERRRQGDVMVSLKVGPNMTAALVDLGWLPASDRVDKDTIARALAGLIDHAITMRLTPSTGIAGVRVAPLRVTPGPIAIGLDESGGLSPKFRTPFERGGPHELSLGPVQSGEVLGGAKIAEEKPSEAQPCDTAPHQLFEVDPVELWGPRLSLWLRRRIWAPGWGPRPDQEGCLVPDYLL
jgi:hypothetical protein